VIVDTSAIVAVFLRAPGHERLLASLDGAVAPGIGAPTLAETAIVLGHKLRGDSRARLAWFLSQYAVAVIPFGEQHWQAAADAYDRYGKGRHPAALNHGDCLSYATARLAGAPLLFTGDDFTRTDIRAA
jgi:ribonuclease VapC